MGVTGLWRLIEPAGKPVPVETLENKVLAIDISIWLHQMVKGYQDAKGAPLPNAHLMGLFQRLCKLLYFRIKPVFVFDGGFPDLKRETIAKRQDNKSKYNSESERLKRELAILLSKKTAVNSLLGKQISPKKASNTGEIDKDDIFKLPALPQREETESESEDEHNSSGSVTDLHSVDINSENFQSLPVKEKYDLLIELKETRKMNSWGRLHELPKKSDNFSDFQMQRLLKRRKVQECLEETEKEMGDCGMSLNELESLLNEEGIDTKIESIPTRRIASNDTTRFLLLNNVKEAIAEAKKKKDKNKPSTSKIEEEIATTEEGTSSKNELEDDLQRAIKMSLECVNENDTSTCTSKTDDSWTSVMSNSDYSDSEEEDGFEQSNDMSSAKAYIMQYSDFTYRAINKIVAKKNTNKHKSRIPKVNQIIEELNKEKSVIVDNIDLSSSDDDCIQDNPDFIKGTSAENQNDVELNSTREETDEDKDQSENNSETLNKICENKNQIVFGTSKDIDDVNMIDITQASVVCVGSPVKDIISLDSSTDEDIQADAAKRAHNVKKGSSESDFTDDDFEEVVDQNEQNKALIELTLNVGDVPDNDIFADVFVDNGGKDKRNNKEVAVDSAMLSLADKKVDNDIINNTTRSQQHIQGTHEIPNNISTKNIVTATDQEQDFVNKTNIINTFSVHDLELIDKINQIIEKVDVTSVTTNKADSIDEQSKINQETRIVTSDISKPSQQPISAEKLNSIPEKLHNEEQELLQEKGRLDCTGRKEKVEVTSATTNKADSIDEQSNMNQKTRIVTSDISKLPQQPISEEKLNSIAEDLHNEEQELLQEKGRLDRIGRNITEQMTKEAQELLQIFGIPYVVAPMEAEAQCAFLESVKLTDGTITDDSDIWLFGGRTVYKNFFNQKKHVLQYLADKIERSFNLTREQLVLLALLVGSDYTTGVNGVGPVTALEILASFPFNKKQFLNEASKQGRYGQIMGGLQEFKKWVRGGKRTDNTTLKKKLKNINLTDDFPSVRVVQAYLEPNVEKSNEKFSWGELDITVLRDYTKAKFGWSQNKLDEIIKPVLKRITDRKTQKTVQDYFKRKIEFQSLDDQLSKRVKAAVQRMGPEMPADERDVTEQKEKPVRKRKLNKSKNSKEAGPSNEKLQKSNEDVILTDHGVKIVSQIQEDGKSCIEISIPKTDRYQEIIPQREKDKQGLLQNKMKAIELFRKTKIDRKRKTMKRKANLPKEKADLSESDSN